MRRLMLMRHAKTERQATSGKDRDRKLEERGRQDATAMGTWLARNEYLIDAALVSTATRARETWALFALAMPAAAVEMVDDIYTSDASELLRIVHKAAATEAVSLGIVGHNPTLHELALCLVNGGDNKSLAAMHDDMPTMAVAVIDFDTDDWSDVRFRSGKLKLFTSPKILKDAAGPAQ